MTNENLLSNTQSIEPTAKYKIISAKTGKVLNDLHGFHMSSFINNIQYDNPFTKDVPHKVTFHPDDNTYEAYRSFKLKPTFSARNEFEIISAFNGYKLTEFRANHFSKYNFFFAGFDGPHTYGNFEIRATDHNTFRIFNKNTADYLVEIFNNEDSFNNGAFIKGSHALVPNNDFNSEFIIVKTEFAGCNNAEIQLEEI